MKANLKLVFQLLTNSGKIKIFLLVLARSALAIFDGIGILLSGYLIARFANTNSAEMAKSETFFEIDFFSPLTANESIIILVLTFLAKSIFSSSAMKFLAMEIARNETEVSQKLFHNLLSAPLHISTSKSKIERAYALTTSNSFGFTNLLMTFATIISEGTLLVLIILIFSVVNPAITLGISLYFLGIGALIHKFVGNKLQAIGVAQVSSAIESTNLIQDSLSTIREVKTLDKGGEFVKTYGNARRTLAESNASIFYLNGIPRYIVESALVIGAILLSLILFHFESADKASATLAIFLTGAFRIMGSMLPLQAALGTLKQIGSQITPFRELLFELSDLEQSKLSENLNKQQLALTHNENAVEVRGVYFNYPEKTEPTLSEINLEIKLGTTVAFLGPSGAGKSTLVDLILGLLTPSRGSVLINPSIEKSKIGYVPQRPGMIHGSILENITLNFSAHTYDADRLEFALQQANIFELVDSLPNGINTALGPQANSFSGGQLQRIGLARALYINPKLLVLDEATSALDAESEEAISKTLRQLKGKCTTIFIAHKLKTVQDADILFVIENGKVTQSGTFTELANNSDLVAKYIKLSTLKN